MYAVVRSGGKQVRVAPGEHIRVEKLAGSVGDTIELDQVLLVEGVKAIGKITAQARGPKIIIFKMKRRKRYRRKAGHRQAYTEILVDRIEG